MATKRSNTPILIGVGAVLTLGTIGGILWYRSIYLSKDFKLTSLTKSTTATQQGITEQQNPPGTVVATARRFAKRVLQPVRNLLGVAIFTNSWWRHPLTNKAVGGKEDSGHLNGDTVDLRIVVDGLFRNDLLAKAILASGVPFTKMILEYGTLNRPKWIHLRSIDGRNDRKIYRITESGTVPITEADVYSLAA